MESTSSSSNKRRWDLRAESELRFEVPAESTLTLTLLSGSAEVFGSELVLNKTYTFCDVKLAAFTWYGAQIETSSPGVDAVYVAEETPMMSYVNTHAQLEARRDQALAIEGQGPRVLIAGQVDSGKSSLSSILCSYAARLGRSPIFVDLDVGQGNIGVPGVIGAVHIDATMVPMEEGVVSLLTSGGISSTSSTSTTTLASPLTYFYGHDNLGKNPELYKKLVDQLASCVDQRLELDKESRGSGVIVNTAGWIDGIGFNLLLHAVHAMKIDVVLVIGHDRLYSDMTGALGSTGTTIVKLPRSGGVVQRDTKYRRSTRMKRIHQYFYGPIKGPGGAPSLSPAAIELSFDDVTIIRIGDSGMSASIAPIGVDVRPDPLSVNIIDPAPSLLHSLLAVVHPVGKESLMSMLTRGGGGGASSSIGNTTEEVDAELVNANVAGLLHVTQVDLERRRFRFLSPCPGALPSRYLILGSIVWVENT